MSLAMFKLVFFIPKTHTKAVLERLFAFDPERIGAIGNYRSCAFVSGGVGQFGPVGEAKPVIGRVGELERVEEDRVEVAVSGDIVDVVGHLKKIHPYEEVAYDVYRVERCC